MTYHDEDLLVEIRELLRVMTDEQQKLLKDIRDLKEEQKRLKDEIKLSNMVLGNITARYEIMH